VPRQSKEGARERPRQSKWNEEEAAGGLFQVETPQEDNGSEWNEQAKFGFATLWLWHSPPQKLA
jgi:hypothetical protein